LDVRLCRVSGYDYRKRGAQTVTIKVNGLPVLSNFTVNTKVPAGATIKPIKFQESVLPGEGEGYRQVYLKGETFTMEGSKLRVEVVSGGSTILLSHANGGLLDGDQVTYKEGGRTVGVLDTKGLQTLSLALDNGKAAEFDVYVADAAPQVFFDYGFRRTHADPTGKGPSGGKYYVKKGTSISLAPVRYLIGYKADHTPDTVSYSWTVNGASQSVTTETFVFVPASAGMYTVQVSVNGRNFLTGNTETKTATTQVVCFERTPPANADGWVLPSGEKLKHFAPGQFTEQGSGYGWSLGAALGYEVWGVPAGTTKVSILGNGFGGWNEPGVVWTQADENGNGIPDEEWIEHKGNDDTHPTYKDRILRRHAITYFRVAAGSGEPNQFGQIIRTVCWVDARGRMGVIGGGWPSAKGWTEKGIEEVKGDWMTFTGTLLRDSGGMKINDGTLNSGGQGINGYVDVYDTNAGQLCTVSASSIRFVKVQTAYFQYGGAFGDHSTEIVRSDPGFTDQSGGFQNPLGSIK
jgi:hypothetical protein